MVQIMMMGEHMVHIDGYRGILSFCDEEIKLLTRNRILSVTGARLAIRSFNGIEIEINGLIHSVSFNNE